MGCLNNSSVSEKDAISKLTSLKGRVMTSIETNNIKISLAEKKIDNLDNQIKQGENDLKQNQYSYSDSEKKTIAKKLYELTKDRAREQKNLDSLRAYNETLKNNLSMLEGKIEELRNAQQINEGNELMKELNGIDTGEALKRNIENVMTERQKEEEHLRILQQGNNVINSDLGVTNEDDYLKQLLGNNTAGAAPVY